MVMITTGRHAIIIMLNFYGVINAGTVMNIVKNAITLRGIYNGIRSGAFKQ